MPVCVEFKLQRGTGTNNGIGLHGNGAGMIADHQLFTRRKRQRFDCAVWFDRVGGIRLARQQLFDGKGEIDSDIVYGREGALTATPTDYANLPLRIQVTRPKDKYTMSLTYQSPEAVTIGKNYPATAFVLQNTWNLEEVDLDQKLREATAGKPASNANTAARP